jgi:hypothetical protein
MLPRKLLVVLLLAVLVSAVAYAQVKPAVNPDDPIIMTKGMYADLLCVAASTFSDCEGGVQFTYDPASDTVKATHLPATNVGDEGRHAVNNAAVRKAAAKSRANFKLNLLLAQLRRHVSPVATSTFSGF